MTDAGSAGELCKNPRCDKDPDSIFYPSTARCSQEEEDRQLEKLRLMLKGLPKRGSGRSLLF